MQYQIFPFENFQILWFLITFLVLITASFLDIKNRKIPNWLNFGGILLMLIYFFTFTLSSEIQTHLWGFLIGSFIFMTFFILKIFGGGDAKLMMFISLSFGVYLLFSVCLWIFIMGGIQAFIYLYFFKKKSIPYGVAIFLGSLGYIFSSFFI